jgi:hypothetical protein
MDQECPKCGMICPSTTRFCDCGYDFEAKQVDRHHAPKYDPSTGFFAQYQLVRAGIAGVAIGLFGIGLLLWEFAEEPSFWGVVRSALIALFGFGLLGLTIWAGLRSG